MRKLLNNTWTFRIAAACVMLAPAKVWAAGPPVKSELDNPLAVTLLIVIGALLLAIALLAHVVIGAAQLKVERFKKDQAIKTAKTVTILALCLLSTGVFAQTAPDAGATAPAVSTTVVNGLSDASFYALLTVIGLELVIILWMLLFLRSFIAKEYAIEAAVAEGENAAPVKDGYWKKLWMKANSFRSLKEEGEIDMGHDYDNIRELDNKLPPWWVYGFYVTIFFAVVYLWRYHVAHSAPLSAQEYENEVAKGEEEKANNLRKAGSSVDENTVKYLTAAADIEAGKKLFTGTCVACHAADGGGGVGPNLADEYWIHGGSINDIFKSIKYGWPDKGMQPWKSTFSGQQMAQLASYIKSIKGTKVASPKAPQGDVYKETPPAADTTKTSAAVKQP